MSDAPTIPPAAMPRTIIRGTVSDGHEHKGKARDDDRQGTEHQVQVYDREHGTGSIERHGQRGDSSPERKSHRDYTTS